MSYYFLTCSKISSVKYLYQVYDGDGDWVGEFTSDKFSDEWLLVFKRQKSGLHQMYIAPKDNLLKVKLDGHKAIVMKVEVFTGNDDGED